MFQCNLTFHYVGFSMIQLLLFSCSKLSHQVGLFLLLVLQLPLQALRLVPLQAQSLVQHILLCLSE